MATKIETQAQADKVIAAVRSNPDRFTPEQLQEVDTALRAFRMSKVEADPANQPAFRPGPESQVGTPLSQAVPDFPGASAIDRVAQAGRGLVSGAVSGIKDFGAGLQQASAENLERFGATPDERQAIELERQARKSGEEQQNRVNLQSLGLDPDGFSTFDAGEIIGSAAPDIAATLVTRKIPTGLARFLADSTVGTLTSAAQFTEEDQSRLTNTLVGGAFGTMGAAIGGANTGLRNTLTGETRKPVLLAETRGMEQIAKELGFEGDKALTAAQASRSARLSGLERGVDPGAGSQRQALLARQAQQVQEVFAERSAKLSGNPNLSVASVANVLQDRVNKRVDDLKFIRSENWRGSMDLANTASGGRAVIDARGTLRAFNEVLRDASDPLWGLPVDSLPQLRRRVDALTERVVLGGGKVTPNQMQQMLVGLTDEATGTGALFKDLGSSRARRAAQTLKEAALADVDAAIQQGGVASQALAQARIGWARDSEGIDALRGTAVERLFGKAGFTGPDLDEGSFGQKLLRMKPSDAKALMSAINETDPLVADQMRAAILTDLADIHRTFQPGVPGGFDTAGLLRDLTGGAGKRSTVEVLFPGDEELQKGMKVLDRLVFGNKSAAGTDSLIQREREVAVTLGSAAAGQGSVGFLLRTMVGLKSSDELEAMLFSPRAVENIRRLSLPGKVDATSQVAIDVAQELSRNFANISTDRAARDKRREQAEQQQNSEALQRAARASTPMF